MACERGLSAPLCPDLGPDGLPGRTAHEDTAEDMAETERAPLCRELDLDGLLATLQDDPEMQLAATDFCAVVDDRRPVPHSMLRDFLSSRSAGADAPVLLTPPGSPSQQLPKRTPPRRRKRPRAMSLTGPGDKENNGGPPPARRSCVRPSAAALQAASDGSGAQIHPAVASATLDRLSRTEGGEAAAVAAALETCRRALGGYLYADGSTWAAAREAAPHARACALHPSTPPAVAADVLTTVGEIELHADADPDTADETLVTAVVLTARAHGQMSSRLVRPMRLLAQALRLRETYSRERPLLRRAIAIAEHNGDRHLLPGLWIDMGSSLGKGMLVTELEEAGRWLARAGAADPGPQGEDAALLLSALGRVHRRSGRVEQARAVVEDAKAAMAAALGEGHPAVAGVLRQLSAIARASARPDRDELERELLQRAIEIDSRSFGDAHPMLVGSLNRLVELSPASAELKARVRGIENGFTPTADTQLRLRIQHITEARGKGDNAGALRMVRAAVSVAQAASTRPSAVVGCRLLHMLGRLELENGNAREAAAALADLAAAELRRRPWHREVAKVIYLQGMAACAPSQLEERVQFFLHALDIMDAQPYGLDDTLTDNILFSLVGTLLQLGDTQRAAEFARRDADIARRLYLPGRLAEMVPVLQQLAQALAGDRDVLGAKAALEEALALVSASQDEAAFVAAAEHELVAGLAGLRLSVSRRPKSG